MKKDSEPRGPRRQQQEPQQQVRKPGRQAASPRGSSVREVEVRPARQRTHNSSTAANNNHNNHHHNNTCGDSSEPLDSVSTAVSLAYDGQGPSVRAIRLG